LIEDDLDELCEIHMSQYQLEQNLQNQRCMYNVLAFNHAICIKTQASKYQHQKRIIIRITKKKPRYTNKFYPVNQACWVDIVK
jgi:hypothetical protein